MNSDKFPNLILIGFFLALIGVILPLLMVVQIIKSTFFLNFFSYGSSVVGLILGLIGAIYFVRLNREKDLRAEERNALKNKQQD
ncbi:MAG: hypothetical protein KKC71_01075 [Chloroflexi bacterium]|nr:hypothetical protein [Chloroflexota bacterium]